MVERFAGRFELLRRLGQGGMGEVFLARELPSGAECALKRLVARPGVRFSEVRREFEVLTRLRHPAVVSVFELGFAPDGTPFYTMEYVPGLAADRALSRGDWGSLCFVAAEIAHGLEALHAQGVVHGDLKPSNLLVIPGPVSGSPPTSVRLLDFGLSVVLGDAAQGHRGTPGYAAPELVRGESPTPASDLYGLGSTLYTLIAGRPAFGGPSADSVLRRQQNESPSVLPLEEAGAPTALAQLVLSLMAPEPGERPRDARDVRLDLEALHPAARRPLAERLHTTVLRGRQKELATLEQRLARASRRPRVVLVSGEPGIGKSVLIREFGARVALTGRGVIQLACGALKGQGAGALALLRRLEAEVDATGDTSPAPAESTRAALRDAATLVEQDLEPFVEAAVNWARTIQQRCGPPVLLLDDSDHLDPISRSFLRRLVLHPQSPPSMMVWTLRGGSSHLPKEERVLLEAEVAEALELGRLTPDDVANLASARLHEPTPETLSSFLWSRAGGHPGLTVELMLLAASRGAIREGDTGLIADPEALAEIRGPESFGASIATRFAELPEYARRVAAILAVLDAPADADRLRALDPSAGDEAVEALLAAGLATRDAFESVALASPTIGERVLESIGDEACRRLHRAALSLGDLSDRDRFHHLRGCGEPDQALLAAAAAFEAFPDASLAEAAAELAEAHVTGEAPTWHERAARQLSAAGRYQRAIGHLERALDLDPGGEARLSRLHLLATAYLRAGRSTDVARVVSTALSESPPPALCSRFLSNESARLQTLGELESARATAQQALEAGEAAGDPQAVGLAAQSLVYSLLALGQRDAARVMASKAMEAHLGAGHVPGQIRAVGAMAAVAHAQQRFEEAERLYREALERAREQGIRLIIEELLNNLSWVLSESGRWEQMREMYAEAARLALEDHRPRGAAVAIANLAQADGLAGRSNQARRRARAAIRLTRAHAPWLEPGAWRSLAQAYRICGRVERAERAARRALDLAMARGIPHEVLWCRIEYGRVLQWSGRWSEAARSWDRDADEPRSDGSVGATILRALSGRAALRRGDYSIAESRLAAAESWLNGHVAPYAAAVAGQLRAELAIAQGRLAEGLIHAEKVLSTLLALPAPADRAMAALDFGRFALTCQIGQGAPIGEWLQQASGAFERLGDHRSRERALALTVQWLRRSGTPVSGGFIQAVSQLLNSLSDLRELTQRAMEMAVEQLNAERGVLLLAEPESDRLVPVAEHGAVDAVTRREAVSYSRRVVERVAESGGSLLIPDAPSDLAELSDSIVSLRLRSIVCVPMYMGGKLIGAVYLDDSRRPRAFSDADRGLLEGFAHLMAVAIEKSRGHEEVRRVNELLVGENLSLRQEAGNRFQAHPQLGRSQEMQKIVRIMERAALTSSTVLLTGENGTGKEFIARILHHSGKRRLRPFVTVNCGAIPESLLESELFGILPNVATGVRGRDGRFRQADGGTLFLDEIGDMPLRQQVALLSVLANGEITPVGGGRPIPIDVRIMAATNRDLGRLVAEGAFREDLFYRLNVIPIEVPPLRDRKADIPGLAEHFVRQFAKFQEREVPRLSPEFMSALMRSDWPGNVRELQNYLERVMAMSPGDTMYPNPLPRDLEERVPVFKPGGGRRLTELVEAVERRLVEEALVDANGNQSLAARQLGVPEQSIRYRIRKYGLAPGRQNRRIRLKLR